MGLFKQEIVQSKYMVCLRIKQFKISKKPNFKVVCDKILLIMGEKIFIWNNRQKNLTKQSNLIRC